MVAEWMDLQRPSQYQVEEVRVIETPVLFVVGAVVLLIGWHERLKFLAHAFDRNGDRRDLKAAARATKLKWFR